jgi:hypothetical protein
MRFISLQKATLPAAAAALALLAVAGASFAGQASGAAGTAHGAGISGGAVVVLPGAARAQGVHPGRWMGGDGFGGPGQHWESRAHNFRHGGFQQGFPFRHADGPGSWHPPGYFGGGARNRGYYGGRGVAVGGYYGGNGVYYTDNVLAYSDDSYRPAAYSAIDVLPAVDADYDDQVYIAAPTIIEVGASSSCAPAPAYKPLQHIYYAPTTQFRPARKNRRCSPDQY